MSNKLNDNEIINAYSYENLVKRFLEYCEIINMDVVKNDGHIFECPIQGFEESSIANTGFFILSTSHLAWHTFPEKNYISFSCEYNELDSYQFDGRLQKEITATFNMADKYRL